MNKTLWQYYVDTAADITDRALDGITTLEQWQRERPRRREEFLRSMGVHDVPACDLAVTCHGEFSGPGYRAYRLAYQLLPDAWGTGNLLLPDPLPVEPVPAVLFANGHNSSAVGDTSRLTLAWPRRGCACFVFDTVQQTDNTGFHRGMYTGTRLDWISRGYTGAGGELLNGLRAFEVLHGRPEVDKQRIAVTGRSGGGAQSFFLAVAEERIAAAVPVVGVPSLKLTVANRAYRGHCDCMYAMSLFQRDNIDFAALIAPRPLMFCFGAADGLYCPEEYHTLVESTRKIYRLYGCEEHCRLLEYPGGHGEVDPPASETQRWFDAHLLGEARPVLPPASQEIDEPRGSVFNGERPVPDRLDLLPELMTLPTSHLLPCSAEEWPAIRAQAVARLRENVFSWLDRTAETASFQHRCHNRYRGEIGGMETWLEVPEVTPETPRLVLALCDVEQEMFHLAPEVASAFPGDAVALLEPRATGVNAPALQHGTRDVQRVGALLGLTLPLLWLNDLRHAIAHLRGLPGCADVPLYLYGQRDAGVTCLYHAILHEDIAGVFMVDPPESHAAGSYLPAILREMDITAAVGLLAPRPVGIVPRSRGGEWYVLRWGHRVYHRLGMPERHALGHTVADVRDIVLQAPARL
ncbi:MAG: alpha/beta hydrolase family protein [Armatimonadota bacterium]